MTNADGSPASSDFLSVSITKADVATVVQPDASGYYSFVNLPANGTYTVAPWLQNQSFTPPNVTFTGLATDQTSNFVLAPTATPAPNKPLPSSVPLARWTTHANPKLKGLLGQLVVNFLKEVEYRFSNIEIFPESGTTATKKQFGNTDLQLPPGHYDIAVSGARVAQVPITPGTDTRLLVGALRIQAGEKTRVEVWDAGRTKLLVWTIGNGAIGLPIGPYAIKIGKGAGTFTDVMIEDAKITDFRAP